MLDAAYYRLRAAMFAEDPLCRHCRERGLTVAGEEFDHIVPLRFGGKTERSNMQWLCIPCHRAKSAEECRRAASGWGVGENSYTGLPSTPTPSRGELFLRGRPKIGGVVELRPDET